MRSTRTRLYALVAVAAVACATLATFAMCTTLATAGESGLTPLLESILSRQDAATEKLIADGADVGQVTEIDGGMLSEFGAGLEPGQKLRVTPLMLAVFLGNQPAVERLIAAGADVNTAVDDGMRALHLTAFNAESAIALLLLEAGADLNHRDARSATALHAASRRGNASIVRLLIARGALVNAMDDEGRMPLDYARESGDGEIVRLLERNGAGSVQDTANAEIDVAGANPRLVTLVDPELLERIAPWGPRPLGITLDSARRTLLWAEYESDRIRTFALDDARLAELPVQPLSGPIGLGFDPVRRTLYWTSDATYPRRVQRAGADGSGVAHIASGRTVNRPRAIAADAKSGRIFWSESVSGRIRRADADGSDVEDIVSSGISSVSDRPDAREFKALGIALDEAGKRLYWTEMLDAEIRRSGTDGADMETIVAAPSGLDLPAGIVVHAGRVYWADAGAAKIARAGVDGSGREDLVSGAAGLIQPYGLALDAPARRLYWTDASAGTVCSSDLDGGDLRAVHAPSAVAAQACGTPMPQDCSLAAAAAAARYVWKTVAAVGTCLDKVDALKAVWRSQSDAARAVPSCRRQLERIAAARDGNGPLEAELRGTLERSCATDPAALAGPSDSPLHELLERRCDLAKLPTSGLDCVVAALTDAAYSQVALRFPRGAEWLEEVRPFLADADDTPEERAALANLDRLHAALQAMAEPESTAGAKSGQAESSLGVSGQVTSYAAARAGAGRRSAVADDGAVRAGARPSLTDNGDGTVTDARSGLMWEKKCSGCGGLHDADARYAFEPASSETGVSGWLAALNGEAGVSFAGYSDWRLPTIRELLTLVDYERFNPAVPAVFDGSACGPGCSDLGSPQCSCTGMMWHCSATAYPGGPQRMFALGFHLGIVGDVRRSGGCAVRAVRDVET